MSNAELEIDRDERDQIEALVMGNAAAFADKASDSFSYDCVELGTRLPSRVRRRLHRMRVSGETHLLIRGLPTRSHIPETPGQKRDICQAPPYYQLMSALFSAQMGFMYKFSNKRGQAMVEDVFPVSSDKEKQIGSNSIQLDWHVEDAFHKARADYVSLLCLRSDPAARTLLAAARAIMEELSEETRIQLQQCDYTFHSDETFLSGQAFKRTSYIIEPSHDPEFVFDPSFTVANSKAAKSALIALAERIERCRQSITLQAGDLLIFDNRRVAHSRTEYQPRHDGSDRWLVRSLMVESVWKLKDSVSGADPLTVA
jgi:L-asparagine oxygenase